MDLKHCICCSCRNCFYFEINNPFFGCGRIVNILLYFIWRIIASVFNNNLKTKFKFSLFPTDIKGNVDWDKTCKEGLDSEMNLMLSLTYIIIFKIVLQLVLGFVISFESYENKKNRTQN